LFSQSLKQYYESRGGSNSAGVSTDHVSAALGELLSDDDDDSFDDLRDA
jgi:predicted Zn-dependent peptidase